MNSNYEKQYKDLIKDILINGAEEPVRDGNVAKVLFGKQLEFTSNHNMFPILTSKEMYFKNIKFELKWILDGLTNVNYLRNNGVSIWNKWAKEDGEIGDTYGRQLRSFNGIDQLKNIISELESFNYSRQLVISLWNPVAISQGNIKPCYHSFQFVYTADKLNIIVSQRSADVFVGLPYDMGTFSLMLLLVCNKFSMRPGKVQINIGNAHIYKEHYDGCMEYINRDQHDLPYLYNAEQTIDSFDPTRIQLNRYKSEPFIKAKIII